MYGKIFLITYRKIKFRRIRKKKKFIRCCQIYDFAVDNYGVDRAWKPLRGDDLTELIGKRSESVKPTTPLKPYDLFNLIDSLFDKPQLKLADSLVGL